MKRVILIVLDGVGAGEAPDAAAFGDAGADTLGHVLQRCPDMRVPNLRALGFVGREGTKGSFGLLNEISNGKDTTTGHWEMMGVLRSAPFPMYPDGFPAEVMDAFTAATGRGALGNKPASGTQIIAELGERQMATGDWIVYTSADSVFQLAAHEEVIPLEELYAACEKARSILQGRHGVGRVIARPYVGTPGKFERTGNRRDFSLEPPYPILTDTLKEAGIPVWGVGKIRDIFCGRGLARHLPSHSIAEGMEATLTAMAELDHGLIFTNLVDFDQTYGHRRDPEGFAAALEETDRGLGRILAAMGPEDTLMLTADHGCDPTYRGTDHTRERVKFTCYGKDFEDGKDMGIRNGLCTVGDTVAELLGVTCPRPKEDNHA